MLSHIVGDFSGMPEVMKRLALVQFFSWSALFIMWIYTTPVVAQYMFGSSDTHSLLPTMRAATGSVYCSRSITASPRWRHCSCCRGSPRRVGKVRTHIICLLCGAAGYASFLLIRDPEAADSARNRRRHRLGVDPRHALCDPRLAACRRRSWASIWGCSTYSSSFRNCWWRR